MPETQTFWRHRHFPDLVLLHAHFTRHRYALHTHPSYVIALITAGCERIRIGQRSVIAPAGTIAVVNPEEWHDGKAGGTDGWAYRTLYPSVPLMTAIAHELGQAAPPEFPQPLIEDARLAQALAAAHAGSLCTDAVSAETSMLTALRLLMLRHGARPKQEPIERSGSCRRIGVYQFVIERDLASPLDLQRLADAAGVTRFQVIRDFNKAVGTTPAAFIRNRRLRRAGDLIAQGARLADAAYASGFTDQSHLTRSFRAVHGITPGMFQRGWQARS